MRIKDKAEEFNKYIKESKAITLIALIITIIILLILAGMTIGIIMNNNLINRAEDVKMQTEIARIKEEIQTNILDKQVENKENVSDNILKEILEKYGALSEEDKLIDKTLITNKGSYEIKVSEILNVKTVKDEPIIADKSGANAPNLDAIAQKTYVTWELNEEGTEYEINDKQTIQPDNWYDYEKGKWANIKTTNKVSETENLEAYWVWIPRYEYVVPTNATASQIEVKFIKKDQITPDTDKNYIIHPAFTNEGNGGFGELDGIWVAKFEAVSNTPTATNGGGNNSNLKVQVIPNNPSWRNIETKNIFTVSKKMTNNDEVLAGSVGDSHMMKNIEWGAVAILSQSKYGVYNSESINGEKGDKEYQIWNNSSTSYITGSVGTSKDAKSTEVLAYNSANGPKASTTGTVYGIYDLAGGAWEYVAGVIKGNSTDGSKDLYYASSIFGIPNHIKPEISALDFAKKYLNLYNYRTLNTDYHQYIIGDATLENKDWNKDCRYFAHTAAPVFTRGRIF